MPHMKMDEALDDAGIVGGSPVDRVIGMLLERTEAVRELHETMRAELRELVDTHADVKAMMARFGERLEAHEKVDVAAFASVNASNQAILTKLDNLSAQINTATTASIIQKAQFNAGWKVIVVIGGLAMAVFGIFSIFFNHVWK